MPMRIHCRRAPASNLLLLLLVLTLAACSAADVLNSMEPADSYRLARDIAYGKLPRQKLDIYMPVNPLPEKPVVVFFYGGSWQAGSKEFYPFIGQALASRGYTVAIPDYRLYPEVHYPDFLHDAAKAVAWVKAHAEIYGADPGSIFLLGHSAGAYNAAMLALHPTLLRQEGVHKSELRGMIGLAGPYDFLPFTDPAIIEIFSTERDRATQPITYATADAPPLLLLTGDADDTVAPANSYHLAAAQEALGARAQTRAYADIGHYGIILSLSSFFRGKAPVLRDMDHFMRGQLDKKKPRSRELRG